MEKQPFDENGLQQLLNELYALPDQELSEQAYAFRNQPKLWINGHFELDQQQLHFLEEMSPEATTFLAQQGGFAIEHRLPITLTKINQPQDAGGKEDEPKQDKWFTTKSSLSASAAIDGQSTAGGSLELEVAYVDQPQQNRH